MRMKAGRSSRRTRAVCVLGVALALCGVVGRPAWAQVADAVIEVTAVDDSGAALPGVTVTLARPDTGFQQTIVTDAVGLARAVALPPGGYTIRIELSGFATITEEHVVVRVGQTARLNVTMKVAQIAETVNVVGQASLVDIFKTDSSTNIVPEQIEALPVQDRDFQRLAFLTPGVQRERGGNRFIGNGPVVGAAGNASQATIMVDGVDFTDPALGLARARFSQDAISEFRVFANRFDSEIGGSAGGALSIVTKSGTNDVKGSAFSFFRDKSLKAKGALDLQKNDYSRQQWGATLGGPIVKDKTHYFASFEQINEDAIQLFRPVGAFVSQAADLPFPLNQSLLFGGVDHRVNADQNLRVKFVYEHYRQQNFRTGGVVDLPAGMNLNRDNWNLTATHSLTLGGAGLNQFSLQVGRRKFQEPNNTQAMGEWFSSGNTLQTGANIVGDQNDVGNIVEVRDTFFKHLGTGRWAQEVKFGGAIQHVKDYWNFPVYPRGLMLYLTDTRAIPLVYVGTSGKPDDTVTTNLISGFVQTEFRPTARLSLNAGVRYDLDTDGNNPNYTSPLMPSARGRDANNVQPRGGMSWDLTGTGRHVVRAGAGLFTGRLLLVPAHIERMQNGFTGLIIQQRLSGIAVGLPALAIDPANPSTTGIALPRDAARNSDSFVNPYAGQVTGGYTVKLGTTGLFADFEGIYVKGQDEVIIRDLNWKGNAVGGGRPNPSFNQINAYTNEGRSDYKAFVTSLNGTLKGGHVVTASLTIASKKNINDDFSPALTDYPNDPANIDAEFGRSRADERVRFVSSAILRLPASVTIAPIFEFGSGQPWNSRLGYDFNGDGKVSDRPAGLPKFSQNGPKFASLNLRGAYRLPFGKTRGADLIAEMFNLLNRTNYDVNSVIGGQYLSGPTLTNPALPFVANTKYGQYTATLPPFEAQLGVRVTF
jgi:carboxypeptidase family protein/TonB-dependent receptor-like protein